MILRNSRLVNLQNVILISKDEWNYAFFPWKKKEKANEILKGYIENQIYFDKFEYSNCWKIWVIVVIDVKGVHEWQRNNQWIWWHNKLSERQKEYDGIVEEVAWHT